MIRLLPILLLAWSAFAAEPAATRLVALPFTPARSLGHVTGVAELPDGRLLVSDASGSRVQLVDAAGAVKPWGAAGAGDGQYAQPGGFYAGENGALQLLDHSGPRVLVISPKGDYVRSYSAAERGVRSSSDGDADQQRLDAKGNVYYGKFGMMNAGTVRDLVRLDPATQTRSTITTLRLPESHTISAGGGMTFSKAVIGSPADGWALAPDGRVAVVHAQPYQIEWFANGASTRGPEIAFDVLPFTDADKRAFEDAHKGQPNVGASMMGQAASNAEMATRFAATKPPFMPDDVIASPRGDVWVRRTAAFGATSVIYDIFDGTGARINRVALPAGGRIVGFGARVVYVREGDGASETLKKYRLP